MSNYQLNGLTIRRGSDVPDPIRSGRVSHTSPTRTIVMTWDATNMGDFPADLNNDGTNDGFSNEDVAIPAGGTIISSRLVATEALTSGGSPTVDVGLYQLDGTVIDADGIDAAVALTALNAKGETVVCDGALAANVPVGANDAYIKPTVNTATFTGGKLTLIIEFLPPLV